MGLSVHLRSNSRTITDRRLEPGEGVSIFGKSTSLMGVFNPGALVTIELTNNHGITIFQDEVYTDLWGDYDSFFVAPFVSGRYNLRLTATYSISGQDVREYPLAVGNVAPAPLPDPEPEKSILDWIPIVAIVGIGFYAYNILKK